MKLSVQIIIGLVVGIIVGLLLNIFAADAFDVLDKYIFSPVGKLFLNLIKMLVVPIVFFSIALGAAGIGDPKKLGRIGGKTIGYFLVTTSIALVIALSLGTLIQPGAGGGFDTEQAEFDGGSEAPPVVETLLNIIPTNPIDSMAKGDMLQIIAFAIFVGFAVAVLGDKTKTVHRILQEGNDILMYLVNIVMILAPYGAFALIASAVGSFGLDALQAMGLYFGTVLLALLLHAVITYGTAISTLGKMNPLAFFKGFAPAMSVAFSTSSSSGTLPVSMKTAQENLNVPKQISSFVQPLGATINMDGTAIMQGVATVFIAQVYAVDLSMADLITVVITAVLASIGTAGVPGVGLIMLAMVLNQVGLPVEAIGLVLGVDRLLDMTRTAVNITGDASCAVIVAKSEEKHGGTPQPKAEMDI